MLFEYARFDVQAQRNDDRDARRLPKRRPADSALVELRTEAQLDVQVLRRVGDPLCGQRTSVMNQVRSILLQRETIVAHGLRSLRDARAALSQAADADGVGATVRLLPEGKLDQWRALRQRIDAPDDELVTTTGQ